VGMTSRLLRGMAKHANRVAGIFGLQVSRANSRCSLKGCLANIQRLGFDPTVVVDVGVAGGTPELYESFPSSHHLFVEPLVEYESALQRIVAMLPSAEYFLVAATSQPCEVVMHVHPDLVGSSLYLEQEPGVVNGHERTVPGTTLDELCCERGLSGPYLLKLDVQGAELDVLIGAEQTLVETEVVIAEVSLFPFFVGGPMLADVIQHMKERGFLVYDVFGLAYRPLDGAMSQMDVCFVRRESPLLACPYYATSEQRVALLREAGWGS